MGTRDAARARQTPLPGIGGQVRYGRTAAATVARSGQLSAEPGRLSLGWQTMVPAETIILHLWVPGEPHAWERTVNTRAKLTEAGELRQGHSFTPAATRNAENAWHALMKGYAKQGPTGMRVGIRLDFWTNSARKDASNLAKLVEDAGNHALYHDDRQIGHETINVYRGVADPGTDILVWRLPTIRS